MRITQAQLRRIIQEEKRRIELKRESIVDSPGWSASHDFYDNKLAGLGRALNFLDMAIAEMQKVAMLDMKSPEGEDEDVRSATEDLMAAKEFIAGISDAVEAMVDAHGSMV